MFERAPLVEQLLNGIDILVCECGSENDFFCMCLGVTHAGPFASMIV